MSRAAERPTLLLVDDDPVFLEVLGRALEARGFAVRTAPDAAAALHLAEADPPAYAVVNLRIGEDSGLRLEALHGRWPELRIVVLTGYASIATAVEAIKLGATHYLAKPADADEVAAALERRGGDASVPPPRHPPSLRRLEWEHLQKVLLEHGGNVSATARALGMHRRTLQRKLRKRPVRR